jgi:hypothetical protein
MRILLAALALLCAGAWGGEKPLPCAAGDKDCARAALKNHPAKQRATWKAAFARPVAQRFGPAPPELVELIALDNVANAFPNKPTAAHPPADFMADVRRALDELPAAVKRPLANRLAGIYFVDDLGGTGFTDRLVAAPGEKPAGFIVLDPSVLMKHTANSWATWRDGTPFQPDPDYRLEVALARGRDDNRKNAIQYILLHEIAHVLSIGARFHPDWNLRPSELRSTSEYPFFELSWTVKGDEYATKFDADFARRKDVVYYFGPKIPGGEMVATYEALEKTNLPTLYAASHPGDDFAEAFANYVHTRMLRRPFEVRLLHKGEVAKTYRACWDQPRCAQKRAILEGLLGKR